MQLDPDQHQMTAIVLAGDRTKADSLIHHSEAGCKALIDIDGVPMVRRVLDALRDSRVVNHIVMAGPEAEEIATDAQLSAWIESGEIGWREPEASPSTSAYHAMEALDPEQDFSVEVVGKYMRCSFSVPIGEVYSIRFGAHLNPWGSF